MSKEAERDLQLRFSFYSHDQSLQPELSPLPMQYLGGKARIAHWIVHNARTAFPNTYKFFDLFAGTGSVSLAAIMSDYRVHANDIQPYSYLILKSLLSAPTKGLPDLIQNVMSLNNDSALLQGSRNEEHEMLHEESGFLQGQGAGEWKQYRTFCETTPRISGDTFETDRLRQKNGWNLFSKYYANTYFGVRQCLEIDTLRELADTLAENLKVHLLAATVSVMTYAVSSTTHLAQFLKPTNKSRVTNLLRKRKISIIGGVCHRLRALSERPYKNFGNNNVSNVDFRTALESAETDPSWVIYVDPPYFKEHYSRYYHILDTFVLYDYPELSINPQTGDRTVGLYRKHRIVSDFGLKSSVANAFSDLLKVCSRTHANIAISYASTSLLQIERLITLSQEHNFTARIETMKLMHSGQGQPRNRVVTEYLILLTPDEH